MKDVIIEAKNLTKDYGLGRGVFDLSFEIQKGEMIGFVGTNGSGKTTTIRQILGFIKPTSGSIKVLGKECSENSAEIDKLIGYVPGEIAFPDLKTGIAFLKMQAELYGLKDFSYANELIHRLALDPKANLKRMSKGMKQKTALVAALMNDPPIIVLDEPTTGLDPLMREQFIEIIKEEHKKGKTIFMSTHMYEEVESTCDRVALIDRGRIVDFADLHKIANPDIQQFVVEFIDEENCQKFQQNTALSFKKRKKSSRLTIEVKAEDSGKMARELAKYQIKFISEQHDNLQHYFDRKLKEETHEIQ